MLPMKLESIHLLEKDCQYIEPAQLLTMSGIEGLVSDHQVLIF